jgi:hypothetical protein
LLFAQLGRLVGRHLVEGLLQLPNRLGPEPVLVIHRFSFLSSGAPSLACVLPEALP